MGAVELTPVVLLSVDGLGVADADRPDGMHIAVRAIRSDRLLDAVIDYAVACAKSHGRFWPYTDGGVVLKHGGEVIVRPDCCDLEEGLDDWISLVRNRPKDWVRVHNGHRTGAARVVDDVVELKLEQPSEVDAIGPFVTVELAFGPLDVAVDIAIRERREFATRLERRLRQRDWPDAGAVAATVAGINGELGLSSNGQITP
jgi:hypothetical protein